MQKEGQEALSEQRDADRNRRMFDGIAPRYDLLNRLLSGGLDRRWRRRAVDALLASIPGATPDLRLLDVGCGTADLCLEMARLRPQARLVGIDHSPQMLALGAEKLRRAGRLDQVTLREGSAYALPCDRAGFDGVITAFCYRNLHQRPLFLAEARRVLRPARPLAILELTRPSSPTLRLLHRAYNAVAVPLLGGLLSRGAAYRYLVRSIDAFPTPGEVLDGLAAAGFRNPHCRPLTGGIATLFLAETPSAP